MWCLSLDGKVGQQVHNSSSSLVLVPRGLMVLVCSWFCHEIPNRSTSEGYWYIHHIEYYIRSSKVSPGYGKPMLYDGLQISVIKKTNISMERLTWTRCSINYHVLCFLIPNRNILRSNCNKDSPRCDVRDWSMITCVEGWHKYILKHADPNTTYSNTWCVVETVWIWSIWKPSLIRNTNYWLAKPTIESHAWNWTTTWQLQLEL